MVIRLLAKTRMVGSLGKLHGCFEKLNNDYIKSSMKDIRLNPKAPAFVSELLFRLPETSSSDSTPKMNYVLQSRPSRSSKGIGKH
ncbi:hypothetical protein NL676_003933 [Syzygium grande]|nr:hypothetical protein NL676_003933 [Syzygium grande]